MVLSNIINDDIFGEVESLKEIQNLQEGEDHRVKVKMTIKIDTGKDSVPIEIDTYLVSKSRSKFEWWRWIFMYIKDNRGITLPAVLLALML